MKTQIVYGRNNQKTYFVDGAEVTSDKYEAAHLANKSWFDKAIKTDEGRSAIASTVSRASVHFFNHESLSAGVPTHMAKSHADWVRENKLNGIEVLANGNIKYSDESAKNRYLQARGMADTSSAGSFKPGASRTPPKRKKPLRHRGK